jgi:cell division protein FtsZ
MAFRLADDVLRQGIQGISELINQTGYINVDFSHIRQMMKIGGGSLLSIGMGKGKDKAKQAIHNALNHPLLDSVNISNATGIIANFTAGEDLGFIEMTEALRELHEMTQTEADIIPGVLTDSRLQDRCEVILVITGLGATAVSPECETKLEKAQSIFEPAAVSTAYSQRRTPQMAEIIPNTADIDIPAFLRKRQRAY